MPRSSKGQLARADDGLRYEVGRAAYGHQVDCAEFANGFDGRGTALGFAYHAQQAGFSEHLAGELVHARGGGGAGRANDFITHRVDRANVVNKAAGEIDGELSRRG